MWAFFLLIAIAICFYSIVQAILNYLSFPVNTSIREKNEYSALFPTVTVCNLNFFTTDYAYSNFESFASSSGYNLTEDDLTDDHIDFLLNIFKENLFRSELNLKELFKYGYLFEDILISCTFGLNDCNSSYIENFYSTTYGNCFRFNSGIGIDLIKTSRSIVKEELELVLFTGIPDKLKPIFASIGAYVFIHNHTSELNFIEPLIISSNINANIAVSRTFSIQKEKPYSNCDDESSYSNFALYEATLNLTRAYSQEYCVGICFQRLMYEICECQHYLMPKYNEAKYCYGLETYNCTSVAYDKFKSERFIEENCLKDCPLECRTFKIQTSVSTNEFLNEYFENRYKIKPKIVKLLENDTYSGMLRDNLVKITISYKTLAYTEIEESPALDVITLLSNIGGVAGLFTGISVLSFVEIIEILMKIYYVYKENRNNAKIYQTPKIDKPIL